LHFSCNGLQSQAVLAAKSRTEAEVIMKTRSVWLTGLLVLTLLASALAVAQAAAPAQESGQFITVTVKAGESLANYSRWFGVRGETILAANPTIKDGNKIFPGQVIVIPVVRTSAPSLTTPWYYTAVAGDTLGAISRKYELEPNAIVDANGGKIGLVAGQTYLMPAGPHLYFLKKGDTLKSVADRYGTTVAFLLTGNNLPNPDRVFDGQPIFIPVQFDAKPIPFTEAVAPVPTATGSAAPTVTAPAGFIVITVKKGENLATFVNRYKVSAAAIIAANPAIQANPALIFEGQQLVIPIGEATAAPTAITGPVIEITVQPGETLLTYVQRYGVTAAAIIALNPALQANPSIIRPGQKLLIPASGPLPPTPTPTNTGTPAPFVPTATPGPTSAPNLTPVPNNFIQIQVKPGESLTTYTTRFGVRGAALLAANPQLDGKPGLIFPGQTITIPVPVSFTPSRTTPFFYVIGGGETAATIGAKFEMAADVLTAANPGVKFNAGVTILVPAGPHVVVVKQGDELRTIAARYGTTADFLLTGNNLPNPDRIYIGQLIFIPVQYQVAPIPFQ
jgi:LysM repeat protein